jgi:hypothetical protein
VIVDWTDENRAFVSAQWASGIKQNAIARALGYSNGSMVSNQIRMFIVKYCATYPKTCFGDLVYGDGRRVLVKQALAAFVKIRNASFEATLKE